MNLTYPYYGYKEKCTQEPMTFPPQHQDKQPGLESVMEPQPIFDNPLYKGSGKLLNKVAMITGGDSGIGRAVAVAFAKEGADIVVVYYNEKSDAQVTKEYVEKYGRRCLLIEGDLSNPHFSNVVVKDTIQTLSKIDILVNNHAIQYPQMSILDISNEQLEKTFKTNIFAFFYLTKAVLPHLKQGSTIINTTSVTAYEGHEELLDYSSTKGAIVAFTRSLAKSLVKQGIRVNGVAPGPIWTPLIPASFDATKVSTFGVSTPMKRAGQPHELAPSYVYLASDDSSYVTGQVLHINGGTAVSS